MADNKKMVETTTSMDKDLAQWYTGVVKEVELCNYVSVKGYMVTKPAGYAIWGNIQEEADRRSEEAGVQDVYMPIFIPESPLEKEKDRVEGFAPEVAWATHGGLEELRERMYAEPTSKTLFRDFYTKDIHSYHDLPRVYNQWCSVVRWEKTTRSLLRSRELLWQGGHTAHVSAEEAEARAIQMLNLYADFYEEVPAIPVIKGQKTDKEKFAGAEATYAMESLIHDGKTLQSDTNHNSGDGFTKAFDVQFTDRSNTLKCVHQTSWGVSTRTIGAIIMVRGDDSGLVLPPRITSIQIMVVPVQQQKGGVLGKTYELKGRPIKAGYAVKVDDADKSSGWKFADYEVRGVPLRMEIGPRDIEKNQAVLVYKDNHEESFVSPGELEARAGKMLDTIHDAMLEKAREHRDVHTYTAAGWDEFVDTVNSKPGFVEAMWCGRLECEEKIKGVAGTTPRYISFEQEKLSDQCVCCRKSAKKMVYWDKVY